MYASTILFLMDAVLEFQQQFKGRFLHDVFLAASLANLLGPGARLVEGYALLAGGQSQLLTCLVEHEGQLHVPWVYTTGCLAIPSSCKLNRLPVSNADCPRKMRLFKCMLEHAQRDRPGFVAKYVAMIAERLPSQSEW